jgi:glycosyltransferase involved in cell wall biosynthesis
MGLFLLPLFSFFLPRNFTFWVKYAGNWNEQHPPLSYRIQRWWLKKHIARCKVTLNGFWKDQPPHCFSFENPCLTQENIAQGKRVVATKVFEPPFTFAFVGRLEDPKGVSQILEAFKDIPFDKVEKLHFIGDGENFERYKSDSGYLGAKVVFHGFQSTPVVHEILAASHFFLLPSLSEGFPKVIAEAACYGCIPVVSDVGSIAHYVNSSNGFLWELNGNAEFIAILHSAIVTDRQTLNLKSEAILDLAVLFTFEHYFAKLDHLLKNNS